MNWTGFIVRLRWPYTDLCGGKNRPALVLSGPDERGDLELVMVTSQPDQNQSLPILDPDYATEARLPKPSWVRGDRVLKVLADIVDVLEPSVSDSFVRKVRKRIILSDTREYSRLAHTANRPGDDAEHAPFIPGESTIPYAGRVFTEDEVEAAVGATLDFWLTLGPEGEAFEKELAELLGVKHSLLVNSGSSANLVAISALTSHKLPEHKRIRPGDEVITAAAGFPTTVAPILQVGAIPVFIDNNPTTGNVVVDYLEAAYVPGKTKAIMMAHALGNPFDIGTVLSFCKKYDLWLIEDNCDALGCTYSMPLDLARTLGLDHLIKIAERGDHPLIRIDQSPISHFPSPALDPRPSALDSAAVLTAPTGAWGDLSTQSFYPPHHLTMGEGGAVNIIRRPALKTYAESFRDWGRDCWCPSGKDNTCNKRFGWQLGELPDGYDHKYIYSHLGYNLKPLDPQAAIGRQQLKRLPAFIETRKRNWEILRQGLADLDEYFEFSLPTHATAWHLPSGEDSSEKMEDRSSPAAAPPISDLPSTISAFQWDSTGRRSDCSWFGFMIRVRPDAPFTHSQLGRYLDEHKIGNRMLFGGNLLRQPVFVQLRKDRPDALRVISSNGQALTSEQLELQLRASAAPTKDFQPSAIHQSPSSDLPSPAASPLPGADAIMNTAIFLGTYPGLTRAQLEYEISAIRKFIANFSDRILRHSPLKEE